MGMGIRMTHDHEENVGDLQDLIREPILEIEPLNQCYLTKLVQYCIKHKTSNSCHI